LILSGIFLYTMEKPQSKAVEFLYQDAEIHFLLSQGDNIMVNATEMASLFGKQPKEFLRNQQTKNLIESMLSDENFKNIFGLGGENSPRQEREKMIFEVKTNGKNAGTWMHQFLAIEFASWLDVSFKIWINLTIRDILFGNYKKHWDAHVKQEDAKTLMEEAKQRLLLNPTQADVIAYFNAENEFKSAKSEKQKAISNQYKLFEQ
jgi:hypothetical protein